MYITKIEYTDDFTNSRGLLDTQLLENDLPLKITEVFPKGKRINFVCENKKNEGGLLVWFYSMTGRLCFKHRGKPLIILTLSSKNNDKFKKEKVLFYEDSRTLGFVKYAITDEQIEDIYKDIGPDFLNDEVSLEYFTEVIKNKRIKNKEVGELLLEQHRFSGIGNYLRAEILYESKISPFRHLEDITDKEIKILYKNILKILKESLDKGGLSFEDYLDPNSEMGEFECQVYGKKTDPLGNEVVKEKIGTQPKGKDTRRTIHWVPEIQE